MKNNLIVLLGPTGVGKTELSIELAERIGSEIISADSRQFYRELSIGTAVPSDDQLRRVKHHFIRFISINEYYSSSIFERDVLELLPALFKKRNIVIMSGGSCMYIDAVCNGIDNIPDTDPEIRQKYIRLYDEEGIAGLRVALKLLDPVHYSRVDLKNHKRIIRALEICETTGMPYSSFLKKEKNEREFEIIKIGLRRDRDDLYGRINRRVDEMIEMGLESEARSLYSSRDLNALNTVGYRELFSYFGGSVTRDKAIELIKRNSRRYSKRQMTWWAKDDSISWFHPSEKEKILEIITHL
ncbi:MAG TPA: tRNA (adenosine(37)-N6)-dimethylallyltransferase MiaA [Bacteroidales bacterium]|nr:tRNA (adenosine(37)-N6)-dimethylallyltransferase MiaA [Bacteroidales bacterium]